MEVATVKISFHAEKRAEDRIGANIVELTRLAQESLLKGLTYDELYGELKHHIYTVNDSDTLKVIHDYVIFIYDITKSGEYILKTVLPLKTRYKKQVDLILRNRL